MFLAAAFPLISICANFRDFQEQYYVPVPPWWHFPSGTLQNLHMLQTEKWRCTVLCQLIAFQSHWKIKLSTSKKKWSSWLLAIVQGLVHFCSPVFTSKNWSEDGWYWYMLDRCHCRWMVQYVKTLYRITLENIRTGRSTQHRNSVNILTAGNNRHCEHPHWTINTTHKFS